MEIKQFLKNLWEAVVSRKSIAKSLLKVLFFVSLKFFSYVNWKFFIPDICFLSQQLPWKIKK